MGYETDAENLAFITTFAAAQQTEAIAEAHEDLVDFVAPVVPLVPVGMAPVLPVPVGVAPGVPIPIGGPPLGMAQVGVPEIVIPE